MSARSFPMPCPHLDRLRSDLIEAYRSLEDHDLFVIANDPDAPGYHVYLIHEAITRHRDTCAICNFRSVTPDTTNVLRQRSVGHAASLKDIPR